MDLRAWGQGGAGEVGVQISHHVQTKRINPKTYGSFYLHIYNKVKVDTLTQKKHHIQIYSAILPIERISDKEISLPQTIRH